MFTVCLIALGCGGAAAPAPVEPTPTISAVAVSPRSTRMFTNSRFHFLAEVRRSDGSVAPVLVLWSALDGGDVSPQGDFTSPEDPGAYRVIAAAYNSGVTDTAVVTAAVDTGNAPPPPPPPGQPPPPAPPPPPAQPPPPPPPPPGEPPPAPPDQCSNEPTGMTWSNERRFDAKVENGWGDRGDKSFSIVVDSTAPHSSPNVGQAKYFVGLPSGSGPIATWLTLPPGIRTLYACYWIKMSPNWTATSQITKSVFFHIGSKGTARVYSGLRGTPTMQAEIDFQGMGTVDLQHAISWNGYPNLSTASAVVVRGQWARWEIVLKANTPGQFDGEAYWWLNGVQVGQYNKIGYSGPTETGSSNEWKEVNWNPTWGGAGITPPQEQYMWMDHFYVSGKP